MEQININDKLYTVRLSWKALKRFCAATGLKLSQLNDLGPEHYEELLYQGIVTANPGCTLRKDEIENWLDQDITRLTLVAEIIQQQFTPQDRAGNQPPVSS